MDSLDNRDTFNINENRRCFLERLDLEIRNRLNSRAKMAIISIDIDNFKRINNTLGHDVGDKTLIHLGQKIERIVGSKGIAVRMGRDEFSVLLLNIENTEDKIDFLIKHLSDNYLLETPLLIAGENLLNITELCLYYDFSLYTMLSLHS